MQWVRGGRGKKWVEPSSNRMRRVSIHLQLTIRKFYIERNDFIQQSFQKVVKCIFSKKKFFFQWIRSETKWLHRGKKCNRPIFFNIWGRYISIKIKKEKKPWYLPLIEPNYRMPLIALFNFLNLSTLKCTYMLFY